MDVVARLTYPDCLRERCPRVLAFVVLELDACFVVQDCRLVEAAPGKVILALPDRLRERACPCCHGRIPVTSTVCYQCNARVEALAPLVGSRRERYVSICFPSCQEFRAVLEAVVVAEYLASGRPLPEAVPCPA